MRVLRDELNLRTRRIVPIKKSRYTPEQVAFGLRQAEEGIPVAEVCRKMGISEQTLIYNCFWAGEKSAQARSTRFILNAS